MANKPILKFNSQIEFAQFGRDTIAYVRRVNTDELISDFVDELGDEDLLPAGLDMWGLFSADGEPIAVSDDKNMLFEDAAEHDLVTVSRQ